MTLRAVRKREPTVETEPGDPQRELFEPVHESLQPDRLSNLSERVYAEHWRDENRPDKHRGGMPLLAWICYPSDQRSNARWPFLECPPPISRRDAAVAASLVQWLGTNCGRGFIWSCEREIERLSAVESQILHHVEALSNKGWFAPKDLQERAKLILYGIHALTDQTRQTIVSRIAGALAEARWRDFTPLPGAPRGIVLTDGEE